METTIHYNHRTNDKPYKYILPPNPQQKYKSYEKQIQQVLKQTQRCPFPKIRQLMILFRLDQIQNKHDKSSKSMYNSAANKLMFGTLIPNNMGNTALKHSYEKKSHQHENQNNLQVIDINRNYTDILKQAYYQKANKKKQDDILVKMVQESQISYIKIDQLLDCTRKYNTLYKKVRSSLQDEYPSKLDEIEQINRQNQQQVRQLEKQFMQKNRMKADDEQTKDKKYTQLLRTLAHQKISLYEKNKTEYQITNQNILNIQNDYFSFVAFSQQFERALIIASSSQTPYFKVDKSKAHHDQYDNTLILQSQLKQIDRSFKNFTQNVTNTLFWHRQKCKHPNNTALEQSQLKKSQEQKINDIKQLIQKWQQLQNKLSILYSKLPSLSKSLNSDRSKNRHIFEDVTDKYPTFLKFYTRAQQVYKISSKNNEYQELIKQQKNKLNSHLKKNYGMIVPYTWTEQYRKFILPLHNKEKYYLKQLFSEQLEPLEQGISYINRQYQSLYKQACDNNSSVRRKIEERLKQFSKYSAQENNLDGQNDFMLHLMESCRKLLRIVK